MRTDDDTDDDVAVAGMASPTGPVAVAVSAVGLLSVSWCTAEELAAALRRPVVVDEARTGPWLARLAEYFRGERAEFDLPIDWRLTSGSQQTVLRTLYETVHCGQSVTYGELALRSGTGVPARGIGAIMGSNPVPIVVPCHRVVAADGLGGFSGGREGDRLEVKRWMLIMEGAAPPTLDWDPAGIPTR